MARPASGAMPQISPTPCGSDLPPRWSGPRCTSATRQFATPNSLANRTAASPSFARRPARARVASSAVAKRVLHGQSSSRAFSGMASASASARSWAPASRCRNSTRSPSKKVLLSFLSKSGGAISCTLFRYTSPGTWASLVYSGRYLLLTSASRSSTGVCLLFRSSARAFISSWYPPKSATLCSRLFRAACSRAMRSFLTVPKSSMSLPFLSP
mmetsp:Transcript_13172/g.39262  ORF Transcript_13172/g.39262 Transcript_13172/m.39262 type:complete len:213 (-) Transcript_13172:568-1206(-)